MSQLSCHVSDYLAMRRALGFKLAKEGRLLRDFAAFAEDAGTSTVTTDQIGRASCRERVSPSV
jgi:integrase/recombinase XerD